MSASRRSPRPKRGPFLIGGELLTCGEMARRVGVTPSAISHRLDTMTPEEVMDMARPAPPEELPAGTVFERLTVRSRGPNDNHSRRQYYVVCACDPSAAPKLVRSDDLLQERIRSCGCLRNEKTVERRSAKAENMTGRLLADGDVVVLGISANVRPRKDPGHRHRLWRCRCVCGEVFEATAAELRDGHVTSCGCGTHRRKAIQIATRGKPKRRRLPKILSYRDLTPKLEEQLLRRYQAGDRAAGQALLVAHDAYMRKVAKMWGYHGFGAEFDDLLQEARIAFLRSMETADPAKGSLIHYASGGMSWRVRRAVEDSSRTVRIPSHVQHAARKALRSGAETVQEVAAVTGAADTATEIADFMRTRGRSLSLDVPMGEDGATYGDRTADRGPTPEQRAEETERRAKIATLLRGALDRLKPREREVLVRRYMADSDDEQTLQQLGDHFGVSRERIRQIEARALAVLRKRVGPALSEFKAA